MYRYVNASAGLKVKAIKGSSAVLSPWVSRSKDEKKPRLCIAHVDAGKMILFQRLTLVEPGAGYVHFAQNLDPEFFDQLTAERLVTHRSYGQLVRRFECPPNKSNHAFDALVYALAARELVRINWAVLQKHYAVKSDFAPASGAEAKPAQPGGSQRGSSLAAIATSDSTTTASMVGMSTIGEKLAGMQLDQEARLEEQVNRMLLRHLGKATLTIGPEWLAPDSERSPRQRGRRQWGARWFETPSAALGAIASALMFEAGDIFEGQITRDTALIVNNEPGVALAGLFIRRRQISVIGGLDVVAIAGIQHQGKRNEGRSVKLFFEEFKIDHGVPRVTSLTLFRVTL